MQGGGTQDETKIRYLKAKEVGDFGNVREVDLRMSAIDSGSRNGDVNSGTNGEHTEIAPGMNPSYVRPMQYSERYTPHTRLLPQSSILNRLRCVCFDDLH